MEGYKVRFEQNRAVAAQYLDRIDYKNLVRVCRNGNEKSLEWLVVTGRNEQDALENADKMVDSFWEDYLCVA